MKYNISKGRRKRISEKNNNKNRKNVQKEHAAIVIKKHYILENTTKWQHSLILYIINHQIKSLARYKIEYTRFKYSFVAQVKNKNVYINLI